MTVWDWVNEFARRARASGDRERIRLVELLREAGQLREASPDSALTMYEQGCKLASRLGEPWWVMLFEHWRLQTLLHLKHDPASSLELAVRCAVEVRKPAYAQLPQRVCLQDDLIIAYAENDPVGYCTLIEEALDYMAAQTPPDIECFTCLLGLRAGFDLDVKHIDCALTSSLRHLEHCQAIPNATNRAHHLTFSYARLCAVAYARADWTSLYGWATSGEEVAVSHDDLAPLVELTVWRAVALRQRGDDNTARRAFLRATAMADRTPATMSRGYFDAVCAYHELGGELEAAYRTRGRELAGLTGRGRLADECHCHLERCRLLKLMGQTFEQELAAAREVASKLKNPEPFLSHLEAALL